MISFSSILPALALLFGIIVSIYLLVVWFHHGRRPHFLLFWAIALFLFFWFQVPVILNNFGKVITVTDFNLFFALTFPITFLALVLIYTGAVQVTGLYLSNKSKKLFTIWVVVAVAFFSYHFIAQKGIIQTYSLPLVGNLLFYIPIRSLIISKLFAWLFLYDGKKPTGALLGGLFIIAESTIGIVRNVLVVKNVLTYPPEFWYIVLSGLKIFFVLQTTSVILLAAGFFLLHRMYYGSVLWLSRKDPKNPPAL